MTTFKAVAVFTAFEMRHSGLVGFMTTEDHCKSGLTVGFAFNSSMPKAAMVAAERFAQVCRAIGVNVVEDTDELLHKPFLVEYRYSADALNKAGFYVVAVKPLTTTRIEYRDKPSLWVRLKDRFTAWRNGYRERDDFGDDWGYDDY
jgi:hypothetical protein